MLETWWVLPASVLFSTLAISSGISGALLFSPFFMLVAGLSPSQAVGAGLLTEVFGMGNGLRSYVRKGLVDWSTVRWLLLGSVPTVVAGALLSHHIPDGLLKIVFGSGLVLLSVYLLLHPTPPECEPGGKEGRVLRERSGKRGVTEITDAGGTTYRYPTCWRLPGVALAALGGTLTEIISAGLPEVTTTQLILRCRVPARIAIATSVVTLAITAVAGAAVHSLAAVPVWDVVVWSIPGVLIGSHLGSRLGDLLPPGIMERGLSMVFGVIGLLVLVLQLVPV